VKLTTQLRLLPWLRMRGAVPPLTIRILPVELLNIRDNFILFSFYKKQHSFINCVYCLLLFVVLAYARQYCHQAHMLLYSARDETF
jgi:hypothetical protein